MIRQRKTKAWGVEPARINASRRARSGPVRRTTSEKGNGIGGIRGLGPRRRCPGGPDLIAQARQFTQTNQNWLPNYETDI
jgi:hypothetical protein